MKSLIISLIAVALPAISQVHAAQFPRAMKQPQARTAPYNFVGQLSYARGGKNYLASGTVIGKKSVLTAGHTLFSPDSGWSRDLNFRRSLYGDTSLSEQKATRVFLLGGYRQATVSYGRTSYRAFAQDMGGLRFKDVLAGKGGRARWAMDTSLLTKPNAAKMSVGFAAEAPYNGKQPTYVAPWNGFRKTSGAFYENDSIYFAGGMSGGPTFCRNWLGQSHVTGVIVSGTKSPKATGGVRIIDYTAAMFILTYLP